MRPLAALAAVVAVAAPSCGGSGGTPYPEFQREASAICLRYRHALARLGPPTTLPRIAKVARAASGLGAEERAALDRLDPPADAKDGFARMVEGFRRADALLPPVRRAAEKKQIGATRALIRRGRAIVVRANRDAIAVGLTGCRRS
jgi:hypothetical protein